MAPIGRIEQKKDGRFAGGIAWALAVFFLLLVSSGLGSCTPTLEEVCTVGLPEMGKNLDLAFLTIGGQPSTDASASARRPAAMAERGGRFPLHELTVDEQHYWENWAERRLKETQAYLDLVIERPSLRHLKADLTGIANHWVAFDGYALQNKPEKMILMLERIRSANARITSALCSGR